jgi:hypothetical protein
MQKIRILTIDIVSQSARLCQILSLYSAINVLLKFRVLWSTSLIHWTIVPWCVQKPNWLAFSKFLFSACFWIVLKNSFSNSLPVVDKKLVGHKFWGNSGYLAGFSRVMIFAFFQGAEKWPSWRQWLIKCVKCTRGLLRSWRRHSFGVPSEPQAFPNFKDYILFQTSRSEINGGCLHQQ